jgi:serine dehydrogenase proteinase
MRRRNVTVAENDKPDEQAQEQVSGASSAPAPVRPVKTPMYQAMNAERYMRQAKIKQIQESSGTRLLCYVAGSVAPITRDDVVGVIEMLHNVPRDSNIDFMLHTGGGDIDAAEKIVSILRTTVGKGRLRVIVPDFAKSAGTLIALAADKIVMSDSSELGPIDPQFLKKDGEGNARWHSVLNYLQAYETLCEKLRLKPDDVPAKIMLSKLDATTVVQFEAISKRARTLAEEHLNRWMFQHKKATYTKIAHDLMDTNRWPAHGQMISWEDAKQMELEVEYLQPESEQWRSYWGLYCLQRLAVKDREKLFEADYASLSMDGSS